MTKEAFETAVETLSRVQWPWDQLPETHEGHEVSHALNDIRNHVAAQDARIVEVEKERDEIKAHHKLYARAKKGELTIVRKALHSLRSRLETASTVWICRNTITGGAYAVFDDEPRSEHDRMCAEKVHAVPVSNEEE